MKIIRKVFLLAMTMAALTGMVSSAFACWCEPGAATPGYWKNHPEDWPTDSVTIGGVSYSKAEALEILNSPVRNDKTITMFKALLAAELNGLAIAIQGTCSGCTQPWCIYKARTWLTDNQVNTDVKASDSAWQKGEYLYKCLDDFNNGLLCAPSRDYCENHVDPS